MVIVKGHKEVFFREIGYCVLLHLTFPLWDPYLSLYICIDDRAKQLRLNHVFNVYHGLTPQYLNKLFLRVADSHSYRTRGSLFNL